MAIIELRNIHKRFGRLVVFNGVSLSIEAGQCLVVIGASGAGKSVLLKHIVGLIEPDQGEVWFKGQRLDRLPQRQLMKVRQSFGFLFQMSALFDSANVAQNIAFPMVEHTRKKPDEIEQTVREKLALVGLPGVEKKLPSELSGGQRKRIALARAIALNPEIILYDEPTTGLDPVRADVINELIVKLQQQLKVTSIVVTHDMQSAFKIADRIVMLYEGKLIFDGTAAEIQRTNDAVVKSFVQGEASEAELAALHVTPHRHHVAEK